MLRISWPPGLVLQISQGWRCHRTDRRCGVDFMWLQRLDRIPHWKRTWRRVFIWKTSLSLRMLDWLRFHPAIKSSRLDLDKPTRPTTPIVCKTSGCWNRQVALQFFWHHQKAATMSHQQMVWYVLHFTAIHFLQRIIPAQAHILLFHKKSAVKAFPSCHLCF